MIQANSLVFLKGMRVLLMGFALVVSTAWAWDAFGAWLYVEEGDKSFIAVVDNDIFLIVRCDPNDITGLTSGLGLDNPMTRLISPVRIDYRIDEQPMVMSKLAVSSRSSILFRDIRIPLEALVAEATRLYVRVYEGSDYEASTNRFEADFDITGIFGAYRRIALTCNQYVSN